MTSISFEAMISENFSPFEIVEMDVKGKLFTIINSRIHQKGWSQKEAAIALEITQPRISNIKNHHHSKFSIEALMKIAEKLGCKIVVNTESDLSISVSN